MASVVSLKQVQESNKRELGQRLKLLEKDVADNQGQTTQ